MYFMYILSRYQITSEIPSNDEFKPFDGIVAIINIYKSISHNPKVVGFC